jgi:hypothetical protein
MNTRSNDELLPDAPYLKIQIMSDLHTEFIPNKQIPLITPTAPHLALLGDIGLMVDPYYEVYKQFLADVSKKFKTVLVLLGNHGLLVCCPRQ